MKKLYGIFGLIALALGTGCLEATDKVAKRARVEATEARGLDDESAIEQIRALLLCHGTDTVIEKLQEEAIILALNEEHLREIFEEAIQFKKYDLITFLLAHKHYKLLLNEDYLKHVLNTTRLNSQDSRLFDSLLPYISPNFLHDLIETLARKINIKSRILMANLSVAKVVTSKKLSEIIRDLNTMLTQSVVLLKHLTQLTPELTTSSLNACYENIANIAEKVSALKTAASQETDAALDELIQKLTITK